MRNHFVYPRHRKKRLGRYCFSDVLRWRMALRIHNLPSEPLKMQLWWCRWSYVSWSRKINRSHFLDSGHSKKRFGRSCGSDVISRRMALRTHTSSSGRLKKRFWWIRWNDVSRCRKDMPKNFLASCASKKRLGLSRLNEGLSRPMALRTHNLSSESLKMRLWWCRWSFFSRV
jgi:hypothetical protein